MPKKRKKSGMSQKEYVDAKLKHIVDKMLETMERDNLPPWQAGFNKIYEAGAPYNPGYKYFYNGINVFYLSIMAAENGWKQNKWLTMHQIKEAGGKLIGIEKEERAGTCTLFTKALMVDEKDANGNLTGELKKIFMRSVGHVWNIEQTDLFDKYKETEKKVKLFDHDPIENCEALLSLYKDKPEVLFDKNQPRYSPTSDVIEMPAMKQYKKKEQFYKTLFHEMAHSTGHENRLNRKSLINHGSFGSNNYSQEELCAELTACFCTNETGIFEANVECSAAYLKGWHKALSNDPNLFFYAASQAQKAYTYMIGEYKEYVEPEKKDKTKKKYTKKKAKAPVKAQPVKAEELQLSFNF